jgi:hypothetical protein
MPPVLGRMPRVALAAGVVVTLGACAEKPAEEHPAIIWDSDRASSPSAQPAAPGTAAQPPSSSAAPSGSTDGCREYTETVTIGGKPQQAHGRVCPQPDGSWRIDRPAKLPELSGPPPSVATSQAYPVYPYPATGGSVFFGSSVFIGERHYHHRHPYPYHRPYYWR